MVVEPEQDFLLDDQVLQDVDSDHVLSVSPLDLGSLGLAPDTMAKVESYKHVVTSVIGQLQRTARAENL